MATQDKASFRVGVFVAVLLAAAGALLFLVGGAGDLLRSHYTLNAAWGDVSGLKSGAVVLVASLREAALGEALCTPLKTWGDGLRYGAVQHYLERRDRAHEGLARAGLRPLDVEPAQLPTALVRSYLDIKRAGVL